MKPSDFLSVLQWILYYTFISLCFSLETMDLVPYLQLISRETEAKKRLGECVQTFSKVRTCNRLTCIQFHLYVKYFKYSMLCVKSISSNTTSFLLCNPFLNSLEMCALLLKSSLQWEIQDQYMSVTRS